jgi:hypothetical protein
MIGVCGFVVVCRQKVDLRCGKCRKSTSAVAFTFADFENHRFKEAVAAYFLALT